MVNPAARLLTRSDVERLLDLPSCIDAVERGFRALGGGGGARSSVLGLAAGDGGFHVKAAVDGENRWFAAKVNANFPDNVSRHALPTIQGVLLLFDARTGAPVAVMDSMAITVLRTAAATAVAARHLAREAAATVTVVGCGAQALAQLRALAVVRDVTRVYAYDLRTDAAERFAGELRMRLGIQVEAVRSLADATRASDIIVTCTPARVAFLGRRHVVPGTFIAAVGADNAGKQEIEPALMASSAVVVDDRAQCAAMGDLHHALDAHAMTEDDVRADLATVVANPACGRRDDDEIIIFDSTGVALEDVAAAVLVYERAEADGAGVTLAFGA